LRRTSFDAVYSTSPPESTHLVARRLHRRWRIPWVADFRDPWMNLHLLPPPTPFHRWLHRRMECSVMQEAWVVVTTRWHEEQVRRRWPDARLLRIPNGYDAEAIEAIPPVRPPSDRLRILHAGMLTQERSAETFLEALAAVAGEDPEVARTVEVRFVGPREDRSERRAKELGLEGMVRFEDPLPQAETLKAEAASHILLLIKHRDDRYRGLVPGKLYEYLALERPVLALVPPGEARDVVEEHRCGEVADPTDAGAIADRLKKMIRHYRAGELDRVYRLRRPETFDRRRLAGELAGWLDRAARESKR
jgi:glycosyltransferase involved in cell wall biosynthesis